MIGDKFDIREMGKPNHFLGIEITYFGCERKDLDQTVNLHNRITEYIFNRKTEICSNTSGM